ncbi:chromosome segregation protein SMC [Chloroflexota bacterium]
MSRRLKSLELNGYKTFATKTAFDFNGRITAVVGPNGSGKSNIADALRWVLGEQRFTLLRGRKTDDMIFSGSDMRSRAGMASATVTFDNSDGWLPIDFSEVSITRRAYRDGQNEYVINNQRVRLRDVTEMLSKSGLAERTYTVIGQGLVDSALSLKPEERRRLFEEAAGIGLYRQRKQLAERRLENTKRNLERVQDILAELRPRLRSLERQARRVQEYEQVRDDLQEVLREWYGYHWHRGQRDLRDARQTARGQETKLEEARKKQSQLDQFLGELRGKVNGLRARLNSWHRQLAQIHIQREETSRDLAVSGERQRTLLERKTRLVKEFSQLQEELEVAQVRLDDSSEGVERLQIEVHEAEEEAKKARNILAEQEEERRSTTEAQLRAQERINELSTRLVELKTRKHELLNRHENYVTNRQTAQTALDQSLKALEDSEAKLVEIDREKTQAEEKVKKIENALLGKRREYEDLEAQMLDLRSGLTKSESEMARYKAQLEVLNQAERNLTGYAEGAKMLLEAAREGNLFGARGAFSGQLTVPGEYEQAVAAALGDYVDGVLLENGQSAAQALALLRDKPGKAALLPMGQLRPGSMVVLPVVDGCLGIAADLVQASSELRPALDLLLGQVLVVRDIEAARQVLASQSDDVRVVTLEGEVFYSSGPIVVNNVVGASTLSRPRQRQRLMENFEVARFQLEELGDAGNRLENQQDLTRNEITRLEQMDTVAEEKLGEVRSRHQAAILGVEQVRNAVVWYKNQLQSLDFEAEQAKSQVGQIGDQSGMVESELESAQTVLRQHTSILNDLILDENQAQVAHWETEAAVSQRALVDARGGQEDRQSVVDRLRSQVQQLIAQQQTVGQQLDDLKGRVEEMRDSEGGIGGQIQEVQDLIEPAEAELRDGEVKQIELEEEEAQARQVLNMAERYHSQAQIALARRQEALEILRQRIEDDFGLVAFEYEQDVSGPTPLPLGEMVERLDVVTEISPDLEQSLKRMRVQLRRMGSINPDANQEYIEVKERFEFLTSQVGDLEKAEQDIREVIAELDSLMGREFRKTFDQVAIEFRDIFSRLFPGGSARLMLTDEERMNETGVDIEARLPGKRMQRLALLSGGERAMTAVALVFALLKASPTPFCVLDEVDAPLDEANIDRLRQILQELAEQTQFVIITHNRNTVQVADLIYGITLGRDTTSQMISLKLEDVDEKYTE